MTSSWTYAQLDNVVYHAGFLERKLAKLLIKGSVRSIGEPDTGFGAVDTAPF